MLYVLDAIKGYVMLFSYKDNYRKTNVFQTLVFQTSVIVK